MRTLVEGRGAKMVVADLGWYGVDQRYKMQTSKLIGGLRQAVSWY